MKLCRIVITAAVGLGLLIGYSSLTYLYAQENKPSDVIDARSSNVSTNPNTGSLISPTMTETSPMSQLDILQLENLQLKMELLKKDMQILADAICTNAKFSRESCRINLAAGLVTGSKQVASSENAKTNTKPNANATESK